MNLMYHTYSLEGGFMKNVLYAGFVHTCLRELATINDQIDLLHPEVDKVKINELSKQALLIQLKLDVFVARVEKNPLISVS